MLEAPPLPSLLSLSLSMSLFVGGGSGNWGTNGGFGSVG